MRIQIPSANITPIYDGGGNHTFPEAWFTINDWLTKGRIKAQVPSFNNGNSLFQDGDSIYEVARESLLDLFPGADAIIYDEPYVWEADVAVLDLVMPTSIPAARIPTGGADSFENITKQTESGTGTKTVGEWIDSNCEFWRNAVTGKVQIYTAPINARFIEFHLVRAFAIEFSTANHPELTENTEFIPLSMAESHRAADPGNWVKIQP